MFKALKSAPLIAKLGLALATLVLTIAVAFGTVSENDVHRLNQTVSADGFFKPEPGTMFEVIDGKATPVCRYANAHEGIGRQDARDDLYYNALGRNIPVASLVGLLLAEKDFDLQVEISRSAYTEGLVAEFRGGIDASCESKAQRAYQREAVVCVVDAVLRSPADDAVLAVRFKPFAFTPAGVNVYPRCPLKVHADMFWNIRRTFISVAKLETNGTALAGTDLPRAG